MIKSVKKISRLIAAVLVATNVVVTGMPTYKVNAYADAADVSSYSNINSNWEKYGLTENVKDGAILHAWCWSFNSIKDNMADIAAAGFSTVQTSPANACLVGENGGMDLMGNGKWYYHYQPTDWKIGNYQLGTRDDFKAMCAEADKYGVKILVDVLPNHTTPTLNAVSDDLKNAVGGQANLYHANGFNEIQGDEWNDRYECTTGQMGGLPDVNTENPDFQEYFVKYLNDCIECGADGFRYDTAKHIGLPSDPLDAKSIKNNFWPVVTGKESVKGVSVENADEIFNYGEVLQDKNVKETEYAQYIGQTASNYGKEIRGAVASKDFSKGRIENYQHVVSADKLVTWVESHDTYCNAGESADLTEDQIKMAWALIAARKEGTPLFFSRPDGSTPGNRWGNNKIGAKGDDAFKDPEVAAVNKFRNAMAGKSEYLRNINGSSQILAVERGNIGEVIINFAGSDSINYDTTLKDGKYTDQVSGREFNVVNGKISGELDGNKVAVIYNPDPIIIPEQAAVTANPGSQEYTDDSVSVILNCKNVTNPEYSIDGLSKGSFYDGQQISVGAGKQDKEQTILKVTGTSTIDGSTVTNTYTYTKRDISVDKPGIYLKKPSGWGNNINVYIYDENSGSTVQTIAQWPGTAMESLGNDEYFYELPESWKYTNTQVIFNDGSNQAPGSTQPGLEYTLGTAMGYENGNWINLPIKSKDVVAGNITTDLVSPQYTGTDITISTEAATGGSGDYNYEFAVNDQVIKAASSEKSAVWTPSAAGTYTIKVTSTDSNGKSAEKFITYKIDEKVIINPILVSLTVDKNSPQVLGTTLTLSAAATGGNSELQYSFSVMKNGTAVYSTSYSSNAATTWTPSEEGTYVVNVTVKDLNGSTKSASQEFSIYKLDKEVTVTGITTQLSGTKVMITANAISKSGNDLFYKFYVHEGASGWRALSDFTSSNAVAWTPSTAANSIIWVEARDNNGNKDVKYVNYSMN